MFIRRWRRSGVFVLNLEHISPCSSVFVVNFEKADAGWEIDDVAEAYLELHQTFMMELFYVNIFIFFESFHHQYHACKITLQYILIKVTAIPKLHFFSYLVHILLDFFCGIYANLRSIFKFYCINVLLGIF